MKNKNKKKNKNRETFEMREVNSLILPSGNFTRKHKHKGINNVAKRTVIR